MEGPAVAESTGTALPQAKRVRLQGKSAPGPTAGEPSDDEGAAVVQDAAVAADGATLWTFTGKESMHVFWAVDRCTSEELAAMNRQGKDYPGRPPRSDAVASPPLDFNCELREHSFMSMIVGSLGKEPVNGSVSVTVPIPTNTRDLKEGEFLLWEGDKKPQAKKRPADWKSDAAKPPVAPKAKGKQKSKAKATLTSGMLSF